jgi:glycosyltransferase involved in cell wall biosynthesis
VISFVIPAFNEQELIDRCILSIELEVREPHEIIVVDNGSTDMTAIYARYLGAKVISEKRKGVVRARQAGFKEATGDLVAFIDADSELPAGWLGVMRKIMGNDRVVCCSGPLRFDLGLTKRIVTFIFYSLAVPLTKVLPMCQGGNCVARRDALVQCDGFDTEIEFYGEDTSTAIRLSKVGKVVFSLDMFVWSSARRMRQEGFARIGTRYMVNFFWMWMTGRPWTTTYIDVRR